MSLRAPRLAIPAPIRRRLGSRLRSHNLIGWSPKLNDFGTILDSSETTQGHQLGPIAVALAAARNDRRHDPTGRDHTRGDAVSGDSEGPEILCQISSVMADGGFRYAVVCVTAIGGWCRAIREESDTGAAPAILSRPRVGNYPIG